MSTHRKSYSYEAVAAVVAQDFIAELEAQGKVPPFPGRIDVALRQDAAGYEVVITWGEHADPSAPNA